MDPEASGASKLTRRKSSLKNDILGLSRKDRTVSFDSYHSDGNLAGSSHSISVASEGAVVRGSPPVSGEKRSHHISFSDLVMVREAGGHEFFYPRALGPSRPTSNTEFNPAGAAIPTNEELRLDVLQSLDVLDTEPEARFDRITQLASQTFNTPYAMVCLVDEARQYFKARTGMESMCEMDRASSFWAYMLLPSVDPCLVVEDALLDPRFAQNCLVVGDPHIRFYAGAPLFTSDNYIMGSLCVHSPNPRTFSKEDKELLMALAAMVVLELEIHRKGEETRRLKCENAENETHSPVHAIESYVEGYSLVDMGAEGQPMVYVSLGWEAITGFTMEEAAGKHCGRLLQGPQTEAAAVEKLRQHFSTDVGPISVNVTNYKKDGTPFLNWLRIWPMALPVAEVQGVRDTSPPLDVAPRFYLGVISKAKSII